MSEGRESETLLASIDHVAITLTSLEAACAFYDRVFGIRVINDYAPGGRPAVRVFIVGGAARLSVHQLGNGVKLVAARPTPGSTDICFRWAGTIAEAIAHLASHGLPVVAGPDPRVTADGLAAQSVYIRDPDGNLIELMAAD